MKNKTEIECSIFDLIAREVAEVIEKLHAYEDAISINLDSIFLDVDRVQDFDLTMQIIKDLKAVIETVGRQGEFSELRFPEILPETLILERSRQTFCLQQSVSSSARSDSRRIQLFETNQLSSDRGES